VSILKGGPLIEQGYQNDLEQAHMGEFRGMMDSQGAMGGFVPATDEEDV